MARYRVLRGVHGEGGQVVRKTDAEGKLISKKIKPVKSYYPGSPDGDIVESDVDLCERFNIPDGARRFERLPDASGAPNVPADTVALDAMTVPELRKYAEAEEVDLGTATRRDEILNTIHAALDEAHAVSG